MIKLASSLIIICCCISVLSAQRISIENLTIEDGLSQGMVYDILQTRDGFLWVGTKDGLNRYDGYNFRAWNNDPADPFSLADNTITALFEDSRGWLWVGSQSKGLHLFDRQSNRFFHFTFPIVANRGKQGLFDIRQIIEDADGHIWVANRGGGVFKLTIPREWAEALPDKPELGMLTTLKPVIFPVAESSESDFPEEFRALCLVNSNRILIGTSEHLYEVDPRTLALRLVNMYTNRSQEVSGLLKTRQNVIWGVNRYEVFVYQNNQFAHYLFPEGAFVDVNPLIKADENDRVWILFGNKLWTVSGTQLVQMGKPDYLIDKSADALFPDDQGNIWVGTLGYGLRKITPRKAMFNSSLEGHSIWGVWQSKAQEVYIKIVNKIYTYQRHTNRLSDEGAFPDALPQQNDMVFEPSGNFWLLCGLREETVNITELRRYRPDKTLIKAYPVKLDRYAYARLLYTSDGALWASGISGQLLRLMPETGKITTYDLGVLFGKDAHSVLVFALVEDGNGHIWAGTQLGLVRGVRKGDQINFTLYKTDFHQKQTLSNNSVACLLPDPVMPEKILWIGTKGGGINRLDIQTNRFSQITTTEGLPNNVVYGILSDKEGNLWCSTNRGLAKIILQNRYLDQIITYTAGDGLQSSEFNTQAYYKGAGGELFFGGVNGLNYFFPEKLKFNSKTPNTYIVGLDVNNKPMWMEEDRQTPLEYLRRLKLSHNENNLSFEFSATDFTAPGTNQYKYQLLPLEKDWVFDREHHFAHYTHLSPGRYRFRVLGSNSSGTWSETPQEIEIIITPPWWASTLAYLCYILIAALILWQIYRAHIRNIRLTARVAYEQRELERVRDLEQMKSNFFSNITHEFRTPITLILEPLRQILHDPSQEKWLSKVRLAENNSRKLLHLVNQLLDLAKLESGAMKTEYRLARAGDIFRPVVESFAGIAENKDVSLHYEESGEDVLGEFDQDKLEKIGANLLSNALKFTPSGGSIRVTYEVKAVQPMPDAQIAEGYLVFSVSDTGRGIAPEDLPRIFERFYQSADEAKQELQAGTGIGLALCRELAGMMDGKIDVESKLGKGATFTLRLPLRKAIFVGNRNEEPLKEFLEDTEVNDMQEVGALVPAMQKGRPLVLLAEDNDELRAFLQQTLSDRYNVLVAPNGAEALILARDKVPDIVVSDLVMPQLDGIGLLDALKKDVVTSHIPVVLLTAKTALESRLKGLQHGADAYLNKPFNTEELLAWLDNLLESRRRLQEKFNVAEEKGKFASPSSSGHALGNIDRKFLARLHEVVEEELENDQLSAEDLARHLTMSRSQLHRKLTAITGQSTGEFLRNYRLDKAMQLLRTGEGNVSEIAWRVGFVNAKHFSTSFKERFGVSPSEVKSSLAN
ncbi:MAG: response regulator [Saprospiraceae bacterium]|jgi:signal transduction histidine kinase/DNA-binding response OmpR family regulator/ligand-binding sensor domain-containing protein|nr:response regulator [Saprospiraceae bacterium]